MKVKELDKTVNLAWSPAAHVPVLLAAGSAAQQLDASFNTAASLDIYDLNLNEPGLDMELKSSIQCQNRFHKLVWGSCGDGVIVGGCDQGRLQMYNVSKVVAGDDGLLGTPERHTGPVKAIDFNPFQANLLSSGASESEIFIWDLNNVKTPMTPGAKSQPVEDVMWLSWNKQVQHILASVFPTRCVVWDLRKNEPIIKLSDSNSRVRWKEVAWHPDVATQLCLASEDDSNPVIQLWDLRFATTPIKSLEGHQKGVLSIAWCAQDPELLVSCGKDSRILCWNPNATHQSGEVVCEIMTGNQWNFEVNWCPRNPSLIATSSFDGHASVYSLVGGQQQMQTTNKIADSFPGMEQYAEAPVVQPPHHHQVTLDLHKAPKWLKRPVGASFAFGGKLLTFSGESRSVVVSRVVTEPGLVEKSQRLQTLLAAGQLQEICHSHSDPVWTFVAASLEPDFRLAMRTLLGFTQEQLELNRYIGQTANAKLSDIDGLTDEFSLLSQGPTTVSGDRSGTPHSHLSDVDPQSTPAGNKEINFKIKIGEGDKEGVICRALLAGNVELAVDLCVREGRMTDAIILAASAGPDLLASVQHKYFQQSQNFLSFILSAVVTGDWSRVVSQCDLSSWAEALAAVLTYASDQQLPTLCERLGDRLERDAGFDSRRNSEICFVAAGQLSHLIQNRIGSDISTEDLQELVELVLVAKRGDVHGAGLGPLMDRYAQLLAAQGDFATALMYLSSSQEEAIEELRERLYIASGQKPYPTKHVQNKNSYYQVPGSLQATDLNVNTLTPEAAKPAGYGGNYSKQSTQPAQQSTSLFDQQYSSSGNSTFTAPPLPSVTPPRKPSIANSLVSSIQQVNQKSHNNFSPNAAPLLATSQPVGPPQHQSTFTAGSTGNLFPQSAFTPLPSQKPPQLPMQPPHNNSSEQVGPPPPSSVSNYSYPSSPSPSITGSSRKYLVDPSVAGGVPAYRGSSASQLSGSSPFYNSTHSQPTQLYNNMPPQPYNNMQSQPPQTYNNMPPQLPQSYNNMPPQPTQPYNIPSQLYNNMPTQQSQPYSNMPTQSFNNIIPQPTQLYNNGLTQSTTRHNSASAQAEPKVQQFTSPTPAAPGWNDPPSLSTSKRPQTKEVNQPAPITHPLFATSQDFQHQSVGEYQQQTYNYGGGPPPLPPTAAVPPPPITKAVEPPQPKPPLPEEHMYLQTVFEELRNRCSCTANNPQLRRKLEDVSRKLEILYDTLRENKMSGMTLNSLHQLVQLVKSGDYTNALHLHTQLVSGPDFSQIAAFMPGLKVLIQSALQLGVYLQ